MGGNIAQGRQPCAVGFESEEGIEAMKSVVMPVLAFAVALGCGSSSESGSATGGSSGSGGAAGSSMGGTGGSSGAGGLGGSSGGGASGAAGAVSAPACDEVISAAEAFKADHPGNGGKDADINAMTSAELAADPAAQALLALCGPDQRPLIPLLAWEYGGSDHPWINPSASAAVYCVYTPVNPSSEHWAYDAVDDHVAADVSIPCPDQNPCNAEQGADQVLSCLGDPSNIELFIDLASLRDGAGAGLSLSEASTDLYLLLDDGSRVHLYAEP